MPGKSPFHRECCSIMHSALADEAKTTLHVMVKPRARGRRVVYWTARLYHDDGRLLAACRHEVAPFEDTLAIERVSQLVVAALLH